MASHELPILGALTLPDSSGNVYPQPYPVLATNDLWKHGTFLFLDTATKDSLYGTFTAPRNYVATPQAILIWTSTAITGNVVWEFAYRGVGGDDTTSLDQATAVETVSATDAAPTATDRRLRLAITLTAANFAAGDTVEFRLSRDGSSASDTMAATAQLHGLLFAYTDV